jgi:alkylation response protein AidB-like acyl-CoA dehydrogenase
VDFDWGEEAERFRAEVRAFLDAELTPELEERVHRTGVAHDPGFARALAARNWIGSTTLDPFLVHVLTDELTRADAPITAITTTMMVASVIEAVGTEAVQAELLPGIRRGDITIALGMTEPEAGSDVANVQTRARRDGDVWVIDGQKMFTTNTLSGERTNITYYTDVRVDDGWRLGEVDQGWNTLVLALQDEHSAPFTPHLHRLLAVVERWAAEHGRLYEEDIRLRLARAATAAEVGSLLEARTTWLEAQHRVPVAEGPMAKLFGTEALVHHSEALAELVGPASVRSRSDLTAPGGGQIDYTPLLAIGTAIYAGTSEIQRNIIAQHACGLPRA